MPAVTLFVKGLPKTATNEHLAEIFSEKGPLKKCFVVNDKETKTCTGVGYVTFSMEEDANQAIKEVKVYDNKKIVLFEAKRKHYDKKKKKVKKEGDSGDTEKTQDAAETKVGENWLVIRNLNYKCEEEELKQIFEEFGTVVEIRLPLRSDGRTRGFAFVNFKCHSEAEKALAAMNKKEIKDRKVEVDWTHDKHLNTQSSGDTEESQKPAENDEKFKGLRKNKLKARLIIRNLSFKCEEEDLKQIFSKFGTVLEVKIPLKPDGKKRGFAFVLFNCLSAAGKALAEMNLKKINDRPVAVDWAIAKDKYLVTQAALAHGNIKKEKVTSDENEAGKKLSISKKSDSSEDEDDDDDDDNKDDDDDDDDDSSGSEKDDAEKESQQSDSDVSEPDDDDDDDDDDGDESDDGSEGKTPPKKKRDPLPSDINEGRTIFIRNLSFDTDEEGLEEVLLQFGEVNYIRVVMNADTGYSKGCAFAKFKSKEAAEKCIAAAQDEKNSSGIRVDGRRLNILPAISRDNASKFKDKKVKTHTGTRNLYLAREGLIRAGTTAAEGISETDMAKRIRFEELKRKKLKDINVYVSKTRLCVHNLPKSVDKQKFFKLCLSAAGGKGVRITECHIMYDKKPVRGQVMGQSLGYGFVEFQEHEHAIQALRHLNNNPDIFGPQKRPIVEFSLEDGRKLKLKAIRLENSKKGLKRDSNQKAGQPQKHKGKPQGSLYKGKVNANNQEKGDGRHYSGFMTKPEVEHVELKDGKKRMKVLHMPSHKGPKIRKRDKGKQQPVVKQNTRPSRKERSMSKSTQKTSMNMKQTGKPAKRRFQNREDTRFDSLVNQYKKKLMGKSDTKTAVKKSKWFSG